MALVIGRIVGIIAAVVSPTFFVPAVVAQRTVEGVAVKLQVIDSSGAPVPGACVKIVSKSQDIQLILAADKSGWLEATLPLGHYQVAAAAQGFSNAIKGVDVGEKQNEPVRIRLAVYVCSPCIGVRGPGLSRLEFGPDGLPESANISPTLSDKSCTGCACYFDNP